MGLADAGSRKSAFDKPSAPSPHPQGGSDAPILGSVPFQRPGSSVSQVRSECLLCWCLTPAGKFPAAPQKGSLGSEGDPVCPSEGWMRKAALRGRCRAQGAWRRKQDDCSQSWMVEGLGSCCPLGQGQAPKSTTPTLAIFCCQV